MARFALLTDTELRLVDHLLASGAIATVPCAFTPEAPTTSDPLRWHPLRQRADAVEGTRHDAGPTTVYGSVDELMQIRARQAAGGPAPTGAGP